MSIDLLTRIQQSKKQAILSGQVIELRKLTIHSVENANKKQFSYKWYQTPTKVFIDIPFIVENKNDLKVKFQENQITIQFPIKDGGNYHLDLQLFSTIITERSKKNHKLDGIEIVMEKKQQNLNWLALSKDGEKMHDAQEKQKMMYPSSTKVKRDWDKIGKEIEDDVERNAAEYGDDPTMGFFKQIFKNADPEKRKAMIKSFQTSGGTVLSTDWGDVSNKDYEGKDKPSPPKGQQWKKPQY